MLEAPMYGPLPPETPPETYEAMIARHVTRMRGLLAKRLQASSAYLYEALILSNLDLVPAPGYGTFGVTFLGYRPTLIWDPASLEPMCDVELNLTLRHEVIHLDRAHPVRVARLMKVLTHAKTLTPADKRRYATANALAVDYAANSQLRLFEPSMLKRHRPYGYWAVPPERGLPWNLSYEEYFPRILAQLEVESATEDEEKITNRLLALFAYAEDRGSSADGKDGEGSIPGSTPAEPSDTELTTVLAQIAETGNAAMRGLGQSRPSYARREAVDLSPQPLEGVDALYGTLSEIAATSSGASPVTSMRRVSTRAAAQAMHMRRQGGSSALLARQIPLVPGLEAENSHAIAIVLDTSGSMSARMLSYGISVVRSLIEELRLREGVLLECDDKTTNVLHLAPGAELPSDVVGRGGTQFDPGLRGAEAWSEEHGIALDAILYITDGDARRPTVVTEAPVLWLGVGNFKPVRLGEPNNINIRLPFRG